MKQLSNYHYYGGQNRRFDKRAERLKRLGFRYQRWEGLDLAVFIRWPKGKPNKPQAIPAVFLLVADNRAWIGKLEEFCQRCS